MADSPDVNQRRFTPSSLVAEEELRALETAMIKVGWLAAVGALDTSEAFRHCFPCWLVNDGQLSDGRFGPGGFSLRQVLLQGRGLVGQPGHHKVVGHAVTLVLNHGWMYLRRKNKKLTFLISTSYTAKLLVAFYSILYLNVLTKHIGHGCQTELACKRL